MANLIKHRFASAKSDGPDGSQVQPSHWNDGHAFAGGNAGDVLTRDPTDATYGAIWTPQSAIVVPPPIWVDRTFNASRFTCSAGAWTVTAGNVSLNAYLKDGKTTTLAIVINASTIPVTQFLTIHTDEILPAAARAVSAVYHYYSSDINGFGYAEWNTALSGVTLWRDIGGTLFPAATNLYVRLTIVGSFP